MDKNALQEKFEDIAIQNCWNINKYPAGWDSRSDDEYVDDFVNGAWWAFQQLQVKVEELENQFDQHDKLLLQRNKDVQELYDINVKHSEERVELQKRLIWLEDRLKATDTLSKMRAAVIGSFNTQEFNARTRRKMMILKKAEQALKGGKT